MEAATLKAIWKEYATWITAITSTLFIAMRILSVAKFDPTTAYGILQYGGTAPIILGALLSIIGQISITAASYCLYFFSDITNDSQRITGTIVALIGLILFIIAIFTAPAFMVCIVGVASISIVATSKHRENWEARMLEAIDELEKDPDPDKLQSLRDEIERHLSKD